MTPFRCMPCGNPIVPDETGNIYYGRGTTPQVTHTVCRPDGAEIKVAVQALRNSPINFLLNVLQVGGQTLATLALCYGRGRARGERQELNEWHTLRPSPTSSAR